MPENLHYMIHKPKIVIVMHLPVNIFLTFSVSTATNFTNLKIETIYRCTVYLL